MRAKKANADAFYMHLLPSDGILMVKTMREMGFNPKAIITPGGAPKVTSFVKATGKLCDYIYTMNDTNWDISERAKNVNEEFKKRYPSMNMRGSMFGETSWKRRVLPTGRRSGKHLRP
jgi:ABC-type branched-subunit amino acid transport system substrate-binding protein